MKTPDRRLFRMRYVHMGRVWCTVQEAKDREEAEKIFRMENPHVELKSCEDPTEGGAECKSK